MRIAITDACIFIDLIEIRLTSEFFGLSFEIHTSLDSGFPRSLSEIDMSILFLADKFDAMVLSSDKAVRNCAKARSIEYHGMLWIFDRLIELDLIMGNDAIEKLKQLQSGNIIYRDSSELNDEFEKRIEKWQPL